jgi:2-polyprenyl-6-methoxyphenol hydroxylase-like FAD-dependent oxidoreductase
MSPVGGVGINYAIQDAVVAANVLTEPLLAGKVETSNLNEVQRQRERPTRVIQGIQSLIQRRVIAGALQANQTFRVPLLMRIILKIPFLRNIPAKILAFGVRRVRLKQ